MFRAWLEEEKETVTTFLNNGQLFKLPDSAPYFLRQESPVLHFFVFTSFGQLLQQLSRSRPLPSPNILRLFCKANIYILTTIINENKSKTDIYISNGGWISQVLSTFVWEIIT